MSLSKQVTRKKNMGISNELCFIENCKQIYHLVVKTVLLIEMMHLMSILTFGLCKKNLIIR